MREETAVRNDRLEQDRIVLASVYLEPDRYKTEFVVPDMHCAGCIGTIERGLGKLPMVQQVRANLSHKTVSVIWEIDKGRITDVVAELFRLGFDNHLGELGDRNQQNDSTGKSLLLALAVAGFAAANIMLLSVSVWSGADIETSRLFHLISGLIAIPAVAFAGQPFFRSAVKALAAGRLNMDVPISLAVILALLMSCYETLAGGEDAYFDASVTLLFFLLIGRYLDHLMRQKARGAVDRLHSLSAKDGVLITPGGEISHIPLAEIKSGMILRVFPGERFPVNGSVVSGSSDLDRSHVTGESEAAYANPGVLVEAGTLNLTSPLDIEAVTNAENSFLGEMRRMMAAAENGRGKYIRIADRMAQIYAPAVHLLALVTFVAWMIATGDWHVSLYTAIAVLIITCPCALGLAVPVAHVIGASRLMQNGVLMRDGTALERLAVIDTVVFDKTGTLTTDLPIVSAIHNADDSLLPLAKSMARNSGHPFARAIGVYLDEYEVPHLEEITEVPGCGVQAVHDGTILRLGKPDWVAEISTHDSYKTDLFSVSFALKGKPPVHFDIEDTPRQDAKNTIRYLSDIGMQLEILSGDRHEKVSRIADYLEVKNYSAGQTPSEKITRIQSIQEHGHNTLMVGDGINDAPALAAGNVSMVPASASDVGRQAADFVFVRPSLSAVAFAFGIAKFTGSIVRQNFGLAIAYNCIAIPLAMAGFVTPLIAALAMSLSSIAVVANSFRINFSSNGIGSRLENPESIDTGKYSEIAI
ncbi:MAG: heavy metal translocating P-type ATPase [Rhizobiaceae bacterium]